MKKLYIFFLIAMLFSINTKIINTQEGEISMNITKAVVTAAGLGTRFLPYTKAIAKEMVLLFDKPVIHWNIEEGLLSGINEFFMITNKEKESIPKYFSPDPTLEKILKDKNQLDRIDCIQEVIQKADFTYIDQPEPLGNGHAILLARDFIGQEFFGIFFPDDLIFGETPGIAQLINVAKKYNASVVAVEEVPEDRISAYGVITIKKQIAPNIFEVGHIVEKPALKDAPSNLGIIGRYVLSPKVFKSLESIPYSKGELWLADAIEHMIQNDEKVYACKIEGTRYDTGNPRGWVQAICDLALHNPQFAKYLK